MDESIDNKELDSKLSAQKTAKPYLNKPVNCPWTSRAPLTSTSNHKGCGNSVENPRVSSDAYLFREPYCNSYTNNGLTNRYSECHRTSSTQFFHFVRLMQLFPDVHPATLHTVMTLCKNDFFSTVDKLLYAKRCKDFVMKRRQALLPNNKGKARYQPYTPKPNCNENIKIVLNYKKNGIGNNNQHINHQETQTSWDANLPCRMDPKRLVYKNKSKTKDSKIDISDSELTPVASSQLELPIKPLSPALDTVQDLTKQMNNASNDS